MSLSRWCRWCKPTEVAHAQAKAIFAYTAYHSDYTDCCTCQAECHTILYIKTRLCAHGDIPMMLFWQEMIEMGPHAAQSCSYCTKHAVGDHGQCSGSMQHAAPVCWLYLKSTYSARIPRYQTTSRMVQSVHAFGPCMLHEVVMTNLPLLLG